MTSLTQSRFAALAAEDDEVASIESCEPETKVIQTVLRRVVLVTHSTFNRYSVRVEEVGFQDGEIIQGREDVNTCSTWFEKEFTVDSGHIRNKRKKKVVKKYKPRSYSMEEEQALEEAFRYRQRPYTSSWIDESTVEPQNGQEVSDDDREFARNFVSVYRDTETFQQGLATLISLMVTEPQIEVFYEAIGYVIQSLAVRQAQGQFVDNQMNSVMLCAARAHPLIEVQRFHNMATGSDVVQQSGVELQGPEIYDPDLAMEHRIRTTILDYRPTAQHRHALGVLVAQLNTVGLLRYFRDCMDRYALAYAQLVILYDQYREAAVHFRQMVTDVTPLLNTQERLVLNALARGVNLQSGMEDEPVQFEPLIDWDGMEDRAFRSPQEDDSAFSLASDSSATTLDSMKEGLTDLLKNMKEACSLIIGEGKTDRKILGKVESVLWFLFYDWPQCKGVGRMSLSVARLVSSLVGIENIADTGSWLIDLIKQTVEPQAGFDGQFDVRYLFETAKQFTTSELYSRSVKFACAAIALAVAGGSGVKLKEESFNCMWKVAQFATKSGDIITRVLDFLRWILVKGYDIMTGKTTFHDLLTKPSEMQMFDTRVAHLDYMRKEIEAGREDECNMLTYGLEIETLLKYSNRLARIVNKATRLTLASQMRKIEDHWSWYKTREGTQPLRRAPYAVALVGGSGVAKSCLMPYIIRMLQEAMGVDVGPEFVHNLDISEKYMTGMNNQKNTLAYDDVGNTNPAYAERQASTAIIDVINNNKRVAVMADIDSKGQYLIKPDIVVATTNRGEMHASLTSVSLISILRRFKKHIEVRVKPEFASNKMIRDDVDPEEHRMDIWDLDVYTYEIEEGTDEKPIKRYIMRNESFATVMKHLVTDAKEYKMRQQRLVDHCMGLKHVKLCPCGILTHMCRECHPEDPRLNPTVEEQRGREFFEDLFYSRVSRPLDTLRWKVYTQWIRRMEEIDRFWRMLCVLQIVRTKAQEESLWCALYFLVGQLTFMISFNLFVPFITCGFYIATWLNCSVMTGVAIWKTWLLWREPLHKNMCEAIRTLAPERTRKNAIRFIGVIAAVGVMHTLYKAWYSIAIKPQGGVLSDIAGVSNAKNIYTEQLTRPLPMNYDIKTASSDQIIMSLKRRLYVGRFLESSDPEGLAMTCTIMPICSETVLIPWHIVRDGTKKYLQVYRGSSHINNAARMVSIEGRWKRIGNSDLCILVSPVFGDQKDIRCWFPPGRTDGEDRERICVQHAGCQTIWMRGSRGRDKEGKLYFEVSHGHGRVNASSSMVMDMADNFGVTYWGGKYTSSIPTWSGMCGAPLVLDRTSGPYILGLHSAGASGTTNARFCTIARGDIESTLLNMADHIVPHSIMHEEGDFVKALDFKGTPFGYTEKQGPHATSPYVAGQYDILGHNRSPARTLRSNVKLTMWSKDLEEAGLKREHEAPQIMNTYVPWNVWMTNVSSPSLIESPYLLRGRDDFLLHILDQLGKHPEWDFKSKIQPLGHYYILCGIDGRTGIDAVNKNTSMGIPYCRPKKEYMHEIKTSVPDVSVPYDITDPLKEEIRVMEEKLKSGERVYVAHRCNLKDEAVKINKLKVRVFMGSPFAYLYLMRKYFLPISAFMQEHPLEFETAVGIKCYSSEWSTLYKFLTRFGTERMIAGDYKAYDQKMEIALTKAAFEILLTLCEMAGYDDEQMCICRGLMTETIAGCYDVKGEWIGLASSNPSGHALTVIINSLCNSIEMRAAFYKLAPEEFIHEMKARFADYVSLITYGDDNALGVSDEVPWFNHTSIAAVMSTWGITYTMADKDAESIPYVQMEQVSFLKRKWEWCVDRKTYLGPLEESSIMKTLHTYVASKAIDVREQHAQLLLSVNREYFLYGYKIYREKRKLLLALAEKYHVMHFFPESKLPDEAELDSWLLQ